MKALKVIGMVPLVLIAATGLAQDHAVPRGGGGGGGGSSAGARHSGGGGGGGGSSAPSHGGGGSSASGGGYSSSGGGYNSGGAYSSSGAEGRRPRPGTGSGHRDYYGNEYGHYNNYYGYGYGGYYGGYYPYYPYYSAYYSPYYWGYPGYAWGFGLGYGYGYGSAYAYGGAPATYYGGGGGDGGESYQGGGGATQIRTLVDPAKTKVYVDGNYAGVADDFDGMFQHLKVTPGRHDITLKLEGYSTHVFTVFTGGDDTVKLRWDMAKGTGETRETIGQEYERRLEPSREPETRPAPPRMEPGREVDSAPAGQPQIQMQAPQAGRGEILFDILPLDASVYIDGEFHGKASQVMQVQLPFGRHRLEVVRPGYRTEESEINVDAEGRKIVVKLDRR